jgi:hypothetical protein
MTLTTTLADVQPFIVPPLKSSQESTAEAWLPVLDLLLNARYGDRITDDNEAAFFSAEADAIRNRLDRPGNVLQQSVGPASVRYTDRAGMLTWFSSDALDQLDQLCGIGGTTTVRMPAPDVQRFGNLNTPWPWTVDESGEGDLVVDGS